MSMEEHVEQKQNSAYKIDGKAVAKNLRSSIAEHVSTLVDGHQIVPGLAVVLVGDDPASAIYVRNKERAAANVGIRGTTHVLSAETTRDELLDLIAVLNADKKIHGILVQMPLPAHLDEDLIVAAIDPLKDVDGLHPENIGKLVSGQTGMVPCTPMGCIMLIKTIQKDLSGLHAVVIGRSNLVGKPVAQLLLRENCTVTICHSRTPDIAAIARAADIIVSAVGKPGLVTADWVKPDAIVIDVGITRVGEKKIAGDVSYDEVAQVARAVTPVPGGVGPMTIACLLGNTVVAACRQNGIDAPKIG